MQWEPPWWQSQVYAAPHTCRQAESPTIIAKADSNKGVGIEIQFHCCAPNSTHCGLLGSLWRCSSALLCLHNQRVCMANAFPSFCLLKGGTRMAKMKPMPWLQIFDLSQRTLQDSNCYCCFMQISILFSCFSYFFLFPFRQAKQQQIWEKT